MRTSIARKHIDAFKKTCVTLNLECKIFDTRNPEIVYAYATDIGGIDIDNQACFMVGYEFKSELDRENWRAVFSEDDNKKELSSQSEESRVSQAESWD